MSKQRTQRQDIIKKEPVATTHPSDLVESVEESAEPTSEQDLQHRIEDLEEEIGVLQAALQQAGEYIKAMEEENNMLRVSNMPGGSEEPLIWMPSSKRVDENPTVKVYRGTDLGPCTRDILNTKERRDCKLNVTFATNAVYEIEFVSGRAKVPQKIADYVHTENPGNCMRTV